MCITKCASMNLLLSTILLSTVSAKRSGVWIKIWYLFNLPNVSKTSQNVIGLIWITWCNNDTTSLWEHQQEVFNVGICYLHDISNNVFTKFIAAYWTLIQTRLHNALLITSIIIRLISWRQRFDCVIQRFFNCIPKKNIYSSILIFNSLLFFVTSISSHLVNL